MSKERRIKQEIFRRYVVFTVALFFIALGVSLITRSLLGTSPISSIPYVFSLHNVWSMGVFVFLLNIVLIIGQMLMLGIKGIKECKYSLLMQLPISVVFGAFIDATMMMLSFWHPDAYVLKLCSLALGCLSMAFGVALEITADVSMVSGEYFVHVASRRFKCEFGTVKLMFDLSLVVLAVGFSWIFAGRIDGVREGTLIAAMLVGPLVRLIKPHLKWAERWETIDAQDETESAGDNDTHNHTVITIAREYGSGGTDIGRMIADRLGIKCYDDAMMEMVANEANVDENTVRSLDQRLPHGLLYEMITNDYSAPVDATLSTKDALFVAQSKVIRRLAAQGPCVIMGRCADYVLQDYDRRINLFLFASNDYKIKRAIDHYNIPADKAAAHVAKVNSSRSDHYSYFTGKRWDNMRNYHATFDTSRLSAAEICDAVAAIFTAHTLSAR